MNKKQLHWSLHCTTKKLICVKKIAVTTSKKLSAAKAQCTILAKLAQDCCNESNLAHQKATSEVNAIRAEANKSLHFAESEIAAAKELCHKAVAKAHDKIIVERVLTCKQHAKELLLQQKECDITINGMKHMLRSALKRKDKMSLAILQKKAAKSRVIIKRYKRDNATSIATISNLEETVATINGMKHMLQSALKRKDKISSAILQKQAAKSRVIIKCYKRDNVTSIATISNLEEKVATLDATLEQLKRSNENALIDLITTH